MAHKMKPNTEYKILQLQIVVRKDAEPGRVEDEISALLSESGVNNEDSTIVDWGYITGHDFDNAQSRLSSEEPEEGELINL